MAGTRVRGRIRRSARCANWLLLCLAVLSLPVARAAAPPPAAPQSVATSPGSVSVDELERLVGTLQDPAARAKLVGELQALIAAQRAVAPGTPSAKKPAAKRPAALVLFGHLSRQIDAAAGEILAGAAVIVDTPRLVGWARRQVADADARQRWIEAAYALALVFGLALVAEWMVRWVLARLLPKIPRRHSDTRSVRAFFALLDLVFGLLPVVVFAMIAYTAVSLALDTFSPTRITLSVLVDATVEARLILCAARWLLLPIDDGTLFVPADAETRHYLYIWLKRFVFCGIYGYAVPQAAWWLGVPGAIYALMLNAAGLVLALLAIIFVLQNRTPIARWIAGKASTGSGWGRIRRTLADIWPLLAIVYVVGIYLIYALRIEGGFVYVLRATVLSLIVIVAARLVVRSIRSVSRRGFALSPELKAQFPTLEHRANRYLPILTGLVAFAIYVFATLAVLQAWNVAAFAWLDSNLGRQLSGQLLSIGLILAAALALWEIFESTIERYLNGIDAGGPPRRTRLRTLLPFLRTAALSVIVVLTTLIILSHIGLDIGPLLAGAGVIGVAIGFGSQGLVKDIITGLFMLVEDQLAVGDIVDVGNDHAGVVEAITIRTIRLRDQAGIVHTVPFSEVASVKNKTRDFAYAVARITISYREDIDRVVAILRGVSDELMADEAMRPLILDPFDYQGVDSLDQFWVTLLLRIRTLPMQQWNVGRAFNRLLKMAFDKHGIAMRDPSPVMITGPGDALADRSRPDDTGERRRA